MRMNNAAAEAPTLESLAREMRELQDRIEDLEDLLELRAAVDRNAGKPGISWDKAKRHLDIE
jgi:hypothetical protein